MRSTILLLLSLLLAVAAAPAQDVAPAPLDEDSREALSSLLCQDFQGRMKPLDTLSREMVMKISKRGHFEGWEPLDLYLSWMAHPQYWAERPLISVRHEGLRRMLGLAERETHVSYSGLFDEQGRYRYSAAVEEALRTPARERSKTQSKLISFDERVNLLSMSLHGRTLRIFPLPGDPNDSWLGPREILEALPEGEREPFRAASAALFEALSSGDGAALRGAAENLRALQREHGAGVLPSEAALTAELLLNRIRPFLWVMMPFGLAFLLLLAAYAWSLARRGGEPYRLRHPLFAAGMSIFMAAFLFQLFGYALRWIASGRAPLSNGYESLLFISLAVSTAGLIFELWDRRGISAGLASLLTTVVLGVAMLSTFDPAIGPLVPVLNSPWLTIHVTVITSSYGFLGLSALLGMTLLIFLIFKAPGRDTLRRAAARLERMLHNVVVAGLGLLSVGTLLGGIWANESWGRYWGWDPKETWSLVTILVYALVLHLRWIRLERRSWVLGSAAFAAISSVVMTYFGVNYFLSGLHSYAGGEAMRLPLWVPLSAGIMLALILVSGIVDSHRSWETS